MVKETELYEELGIAVTATESEIRLSYRKLALKYHPDKNGGSPAAAEKFKRVAEAYEILSDPEKRRLYDSYGKAGPCASGGSGPGGYGAGMEPMDIFSSFFGFARGRDGSQQRQRRKRPPFILAEMQVSLEELYCGTTKQMEVCRLRVCKMCKGHGTATGKPPPACTMCRGSGQVSGVVLVGSMRVRQVRECGLCSGTGKNPISHPCTLCGYRRSHASAPTGHPPGVLEEVHILTVRIEPGMCDSDSVTFNGEGDELPGLDEAGDVLVVLEELEHPAYRRLNTHDLLLLNCRVRLESILAAGFCIPVEALDGRVLRLAPPPRVPDDTSGTFTAETQFLLSSGEHVFVVKGEGMPVRRSNSDNAESDTKGKLYVPVDVVFPSTLTPEQVDLIERALGHELPTELASVSRTRTATLSPYRGAPLNLRVDVDEAGNAARRDRYARRKKKPNTSAQAQRQQEQEQWAGAGPSFGPGAAFGSGNVHVQQCGHQ